MPSAPLTQSSTASPDLASALLNKVAGQGAAVRREAACGITANNLLIVLWPLRVKGAEEPRDQQFEAQQFEASLQITAIFLPIVRTVFKPIHVTPIGYGGCSWIALVVGLLIVQLIKLAGDPGIHVVFAQAACLLLPILSNELWTRWKQGVYVSKLQGLKFNKNGKELKEGCQIIYLLLVILIERVPLYLAFQTSLLEFMANVLQPACAIDLLLIF